MDDDTLNRLEKKIQKVVSELERLREENRELAASAKQGGGKSASAAKSMEPELGLLREERTAVRTRIEGLIESMEAAS